MMLRVLMVAVLVLGSVDLSAQGRRGPRNDRDFDSFGLSADACAVTRIAATATRRRATFAKSRCRGSTCSTWILAATAASAFAAHPARRPASGSASSAMRRTNVRPAIS
jgi:hypothetical protein